MSGRQRKGRKRKIRIRDEGGRRNEAGREEGRLKTMERIEEKKDKEMGLKVSYISVISNCMEQNQETSRFVWNTKVLSFLNNTMGHMIPVCIFIHYPLFL
jgi:hypothetical protein